MNPHLYAKLGYDPVKDFAPISGLGISPQALVVHPSVPVKTFSELIDYAKKKPGELNYGTFGSGSSGHLNIVLLEMLTGAKFTAGPLQAAPLPAITDVLGGHIQMMIVGDRAGANSISRPASSSCSASAAPRGWRNIPTCRRSPKACRATRRARGMASRRPRARRARSSTSSAPRRRRSSPIRRSATNIWRRP